MQHFCEGGRFYRAFSPIERVLTWGISQPQLRARRDPEVRLKPKALVREVERGVRQRRDAGRTSI